MYFVLYPVSTVPLSVSVTDDICNLVTLPHVANIRFCCSYLAPEYFMHGKVSDLVDVYAFGVVILELISGRRPIDGECPKGQESLIMWVSCYGPNVGRHNICMYWKI